MSLYFIAITAPEMIDQQVLGFKQLMLDRFGCRVALKSPAHITLIPPFQMAEREQERLTGRMDLFASAGTAFPLSLRNFAAFKPRVIYVDVLPSTALQLVQQQLEQDLLGAAFPVKRSGRAFHPHVTIANRDLREEDFPEAWSYFGKQTYDAAFEADGIALLELAQGRWKKVHTAPFGRNTLGRDASTGI